MNSAELKARISEITERMKSMVELCKTEVREMTEDEEKEFNALKEEIDGKKEELKALEEKLSQYEKQLPNDKEDPKEEKNNRNKKMKTFNITSAIRSKLNASYEMPEGLQEVIDATANEMRTAGVEVTGLAIPFELRVADKIEGPISGAEINATITDVNGKSTIHTDYQSILAPVFNANVLSEFDTLTGLRGNVEIPRYGGASAFWKGELKKAGQTTLKFDAITAKPKRLTSYVDLSKQLLMQSDYNVEQFVREQIALAITRKLQETILGDGAGDADTPAGLFYNADTKANFDFATLAGIEKDAEKANVTNNLGYIINPDLKATMRTTLKSNVAGAQYIYDNNEILGQHTVVSNDAKGLLYGDLKQIVICVWGNGIDMTVDPYTLAQYDAIRITVNFYVDFVNRAPLTGEGNDAAAIKNIYAYKLSGSSAEVVTPTGEQGTGEGGTGQG